MKDAGIREMVVTGRGETMQCTELLGRNPGLVILPPHTHRAPFADKKGEVPAFAIQGALF